MIADLVLHPLRSLAGRHVRIAGSGAELRLVRTGPPERHAAAFEIALWIVAAAMAAFAVGLWLWLDAFPIVPRVAATVTLLAAAVVLARAARRGTGLETFIDTEKGELRQYRRTSRGARRLVRRVPLAAADALFIRRGPGFRSELHARTDSGTTLSLGCARLAELERIGVRLRECTGGAAPLAGAQGAAPPRAMLR
ncbi:hypothetical protein E2L08_02885 [Palleronia sediminis]|uniref:DUF2244 domain-containing protein n=1 Tax=Palleronia sediminis TaxID=2547833 RepID=A0A4R6AJC2_9RHOB|nr:hypothetical protein [Palleronia sediminis]TDL83607.1 hypothetical protein E2L08_02885 [Palleronia sediminis]